MVAKTFRANQNDAGQSLFKFLKKVLPTTKLTIIYKLIRTKSVKINGRRIKDRNFILQDNDEIVVYDDQVEVPVRDGFKPLLGWKIDVVYEDENILIVCKPHNVQMHSPNVDEPSMDNLVKSYLFFKQEYDPASENSFVISHVHRLDKLTSGLVIYAKNKMTLDYFLGIINDKSKIAKCYYAHVLQKPTINALTLRGYITKNERLEKMEFTLKPIDISSKSAVSRIERINFNDNAENWLRIVLETGRKHQIRASLEFLHLSIIGDDKYGTGVKSKTKAIGLYAYSLSFFNLDEGFEYLNNKTFTMNANLVK